MTIVQDYVKTRLGRVHGRFASESSGRPWLVLLHQTASASVMFEALMARLEGEFSIFAPDTPGFGGTPPLSGRVTVEAWAELFLEALRALGIESAFVFGHHTGASIAVELEAQRPGLVTKMALSGPAAMTEAEQASFATRVEPFAPTTDGRHLLTAWERVKKKEPEAPLELLHREVALTLAAAGHHRSAYEAVFSHDLLGRLPRLTCPTLVMAGERDLLFPYLDRAHRALARGEKHVIPGAGTYVVDREPDRVAGILRSFFLEGSA